MTLESRFLLLMIKIILVSAHILDRQRGFFIWLDFLQLERTSGALKFHIVSIYFTALNIKHVNYQYPVSFSALDSMELFTFTFSILNERTGIK